MSFTDQVGNTKSSNLQKRIRMAMVIAALQVQGEDPTSMTPSVYNKRAALAEKVISTAGLGTPTDDVLSMFVWAVCANAEIDPDSSDGDIQFTVNSVWSDCAGVTGLD